MAASSAAWETLGDHAVFIYVDAFTEYKQIPASARSLRQQAGNNVPMLFITNADTSTPWLGISYERLKHEMSAVADEIRAKLAPTTSPNDAPQ